MIRNLYFGVIILFLFSSVTVNAQKMKIVRCTTSSIVIGGEKCVVGDTFDRKAEISWESPKQILIAKDEKGRLVRFSASDKKVNDSWGGNLFNKQYQSLSTRDFDAVGIDGSYIMDNELILPTGLDVGEKYIVELLYKVGGQNKCYKAKLTSDNRFMVIKKKIFGGKYDQMIKVKIIARRKADNKELLLSNNVELIHIDRSIMPY